MSHLRGIFTKKHILVLTQYRPSGTFQLGMPYMYIKKIYPIILTDQNCGTFIHMNVGKYGLAALIRMASSPFGVFQENN